MLLAAGHKWNNLLFYNHTGLRVYPKYALGGGYVLSGDVVSTLVDIQVSSSFQHSLYSQKNVGFGEVECYCKSLQSTVNVSNAYFFFERVRLVSSESL